MAEPTSSAAAGVAGWKLIGGLAAFGGIGAGLASLVVMCAKHPRTPQEWAVGLICTFVGSFGGGASVIMYFGLLAWAEGPTIAHQVVGLMSVFGIAFTCGLPAWALVRWTFAYINKRQGADLMEIVQDIKQAKG